MTIPLLFEEYPSLEGIVPWIQLIKSPTPVKRLEKLEEALKTKTHIWIKLDNLTSSQYGGNKVRKLEFIIGEVLRKKKKTIATLGGIGTNHGLATTIYGKENGLNTRLYLIKQPIDSHVLNNLKLDYYYGAELKYVKNYLGAAVYFYFLDRLLKKETYWLPAGGSTPLGVLGYVNAIFELKEQIDIGTLPEPGHIFVAAGTTGTMAGIELGLRLAGMKSQVVGIQVTDRMAASPGKVKKLVKNSLKLLQTEPKLQTFQYKPKFELTTKFYGGQYGRVTSEGQEAVELIKKTEDITLETTYTGKTLAGLVQFIYDVKPTKPVLFWNTYNSVDLSSIANQVNFQQLPKDFHSLFID